MHNRYKCMSWTDRFSDSTSTPSSGASSDAPDNTRAQKREANNAVFSTVGKVVLAGTVATVGFVVAKEHNPFGIKEKTLHGMEYLAKGFHAIPPHHEDPTKTLPSMHRLLNVSGMVGGFASMQYIANIAFGCKITGGGCKEIKREDVPKPLRFLHGVASYNIYADDPNDKWHEVVQQMLPAAAGAYGAIKGSELFFKRNGREKYYKELKGKSRLTPQEADTLAQYEQGLIFRYASGLTGTLSAAGGSFAFGETLNPAFLFDNNGKAFAGASEIFGTNIFRHVTNTTGDLGVATQKAQTEMRKEAQILLKDIAANPAKEQELLEAYSQRAISNVIAPMINLKPEEKQALVAELHGLVAKIRTKYESEGKGPNHFAVDVHNAISSMFYSKSVPEMGNRLEAGRNGMLGWIANLMGAGSKVSEINKRMIRSTGEMHL